MGHMNRSNGSTGPEQRLGAGAYQLTLTDPNGCFRDTAFRMSEPEAAFVWAETIPDTNLKGFGKAWVEIDGGTRPYAIQWNDRLEQTTDTAFHLFAGDYIARVVDRSACRYERHVEVRNRMTLGVTRVQASPFKCVEQYGSVLLETDLRQGIEPSDIRVIDVLGRRIGHTTTSLGERNFLVDVQHRGVSIIHVNDHFACKVLR